MTHPEATNQNTPPVSQVAEAYKDVVQHNSKHTGFGAMFSAVLEASLEQSEPIDAILNRPDVADVYGAINEKLESNVVEGDMSAELQDLFHGDLFTRVGLKIIPSGSYVANDKGTRATSERLEPFIDNTALYADFLRVTSAAEVQEGMGSKLLVDVAVNTKSIIDQCIGEPKAEGEMSEVEKELLREVGDSALRTWDAVADEYKRLGFSAVAIRARLDKNPDDSNAKRELYIFGGLEQYVDYWGKELLPEFVEAWDNGYITPPEEFYFWHPSRWAEDMKPDELTERWENAMDFIVDLKTKSGASELAAMAQDNLSTSLEESHSRMETKETEAEAYYQKELKEWKDHGEQNYEKTDEHGRAYTVRSPNEAAPAYFRNNRIALEAAQLRFQHL